MSMDKAILVGHTVVKTTDLHQWSLFFNDKDARRVEATKVGATLISTVFLGLDHSWVPGKPLWFETLVFEGPLDGEMFRYETWDEAVAGHAKMVKKVKLKQK